MIDVLGYELSHATALLEEKGFSVVCSQVSSKRGMRGNEKRVIRQKLTKEGECEKVLLSYAEFQTECTDYDE